MTNAHDHGPYEGALGAADAAEDGGCEQGHEKHKSQLRLELGLKRQEDAGHRHQTAPNEPRPDDDLVCVNAGGLGKIGVIGHGAHRLAQLGAEEEQIDQTGHNYGGEEDEDLIGDDADVKGEVSGGPDAGGVEAGRGSPEDQHEAAHGDGDAQGCDGESDDAAAAAP